MLRRVHVTGGGSAKRGARLAGAMAGAGDDVAFAVSDIGGRLEMEDEHVLEVDSASPLRVVGAVFDGHGGSAVARLAAGRFPALFRASLPEGPEAAMRAAYEGLQREAAGLRGGAVAATFYVDGPRITVANAGDAHIVNVSGAEATRFTEEHRITNKTELERVVDAGARIWGPYVCVPEGDGLMVTRSLGDFEFQRVGLLSDPVVSTRPLEPGFLVAACDGLWDVMAVDELPRLLQGIATAKKAAERLAHEALHARRTEDNLTVIVVRVP